jgi:hypothetical protein
MSVMPEALASRAEMPLRPGQRRCKAKSCRMPFADGDGGIIYPSLCSSCDGRRVYRLIGRVLKRHGRDRGLELIADLARPKRKLTQADYDEVRAYVIDQARANGTPRCPECKMPIDDNDHGMLWPELCGGCAAQREFPLLEQVIERFGPEGARLKLEILARMDP